MVAYLYLALAMLASASLSIMSSLFGKRNQSVKNASSLYSVIVTASALLAWGVICLGERGFNLRMLGYSALYGLFYSIAMIGMFKAYQSGSTSLTAFVKQLSLIFVAFWGLLFWHNPLSTTMTIGLALIVLALYFCFGIQKDRAQKKTARIWFLYAAMLLCGNAGCSIVQKYQTMEAEDGSGNFFMLFGVLIAFLFCLFLYLKGKRCKLSEIARRTAIFPIIGGICSALLNLLILLLIASPLSESVIFPAIAVGGLILTILFSTVIYREKPSRFEWIGLLTGIVALVFLNL